MSVEQIAISVLTIVLSSVGSAIATSIAHKIHIEWIREELKRHQTAITRAHERISDAEKRK